jgi:hypothetical protein
MSVIDYDRLSGAVGLCIDRLVRPIVQNILYLGKSLGPIIYPISIGVIATWVIGVFFGGGFFFLMHPNSEKQAAYSGSADLSASLTESPLVFRSISEGRPLSAGLEPPLGCLANCPHSLDLQVSPRTRSDHGVQRTTSQPVSRHKPHPAPAPK